MSDNASVVIFPAVFAHNKLDLLVSNIKKILEIQNQKFQKIRKDNSVIVVEANDPVFASSAINLLFGIERVAIAKQVKNEYDTIVSAITKIGSNLLLKGDRFDVKIIVCFRKESDLLNLVAPVEHLTPDMDRHNLAPGFFQVLVNGTSAQN